MEEINSIDNDFSSNATFIDYIRLLKPRVMFLVVFTAITGMLLAPSTIHPFLFFIATACIAIGSGAAGALNMWYDSDIDCIMKRTSVRPIPAGKVSKQNALEFGVILSILSVVTMAWSINYTAAGLLAFAIFFYSVVYTIFLKRYTCHNIVIGGAAGAFPPIIGWASITGGISIEPIILFMIIFMWTPPHFWSLSLIKSSEYKKAGIPMLPVTHGEKMTRSYILIYTALLVPITILPCFIGMHGMIYNISAIILDIMILLYAHGVYWKQIHPYKLFKFSILYLFLLFSFMLIDKFYAF